LEDTQRRSDFEGGGGGGGGKWVAWERPCLHPPPRLLLGEGTTPGSLDLSHSEVTQLNSTRLNSKPSLAMDAIQTPTKLPPFLVALCVCVCVRWRDRRIVLWAARRESSFETAHHKCVGGAKRSADVAVMKY
jgi:hypothetical protein